MRKRDVVKPLLLLSVLSLQPVFSYTLHSYSYNTPSISDPYRHHFNDRGSHLSYFPDIEVSLSENLSDESHKNYSSIAAPMVRK